MGIAQANTLGIQGLGGVGKSTIAAYFYSDLDFEVKFWADVSLKPDFTVFAEKIIIALGGKVTLPIDITELMNNLLQLLSQRRCLLVVDNLETLLDQERNWRDEYYQQFFSRWQQQGTTSTVLITTREKPQLFQGLRHWYVLGGMKIEEGITLLNKLAIQGTEAELKAFVEYVDGHPLTIKLVAGYLREYCNSQLNQVKQLGLQQFDLAYKKAKGLHRDKSEDARLSWIIQQHLARLNLGQKQFLTNLSVYRLPFDDEGASYLVPRNKRKQKWLDKLLFFRHEPDNRTKKTKIDIRKDLQELCNRSLLIKTQDNKFQFESLVQKYVLQQANDLTNAHQQAIEYYRLHLKDEQSWQVLEDVSEYLEIIAHQCELKQYAVANEILNNCYGFLDLQGYYSVLVEIYEKLRSRWQENLQTEEKSEFAYCLVGLANAYYYLGNYPQAIDFYQRSLEIAQAIGDRNGVGASLMGLGNAYDALGEYERAIDFYQQSLEIAQAIGDRNGVGNSLNNLGLAYYALGEYERAIDFYQQSLEIAQAIGDRNGVGKSLNNLGLAYSSLGEYERAIDLSQQSLEIAQAIGDRNGVGASLGNLGSAYSALGEYERAIDLYQQSLEIKQAIGDRNGVGNSLNNLGSAYSALGEYERAIDLSQQSLEIAQAIGDRNGVGASLNNLGSAYSALGEYERAIDLYQQSLEIKQAIGDRNGVGNSLNNLGSAYSALGEYERAIDLYQQSLEIKQAIGDRNGVGNSLMGLGNAYDALGEYKQAIDFSQQSLEIKQAIGDKRGIADTWFNLGDSWKNLQQNSEAKLAYENSRKLSQAMGLDQDVEKCDQAIQDLVDES